jgi:metallo-beta-lactamase class B
VTTPEGNILINANLLSSPAQIRPSIEKLGFRWKDTKVLLVAHSHFDHAGGAAEIQRETHAKLEVMEYDAEVMNAGGTNDFLKASGSILPFPPANVDRALHDDDTVRLGGKELTAHCTGSHTRGCTMWTMKQRYAWASGLRSAWPHTAQCDGFLESRVFGNCEDYSP